MAIVAGLLPLVFLPQLPGAVAISAFLVLGGLLWMSGNAYCQCLTLALISFAWGVWHGDKALMQIELLTHGEQQVVGTINSSHLAWKDDNKVLLGIQQVNGQRVFPPISVALKWQKDLSYCAGQQWKLRLKMRGVHSLLNEGGFDSQRWAIANHRPLQGRVIHAQVLDARCNTRQQVIRAVE